MDFETIRQAVPSYVILLFSLCVHEWAHAWTASKLGDPTARSMGRVSLNPMAHIDPIGTVLLPLLMLLTSPSFALIGWAKPVPVDSRYFRNRMQGDLLVTLAGPASNLVLALIGTIVGGLTVRFAPESAEIFARFMTINLCLAVFNMIPVPPLDGSHVLRYAVRMSDETFHRFAQWGFLIVIVLLNIPGFRQLFGSILGLFLQPLAMLFGLIAGW